jgi:hypothetical protein
MFRQLCLLAVAFLAVAEAKHNHTAKSIKDSKSCGSSNKKSKTATFCVLAESPAIVVDGASIHSYTQGALFDCDDTVCSCFYLCFLFLLFLYLPFVNQIINKRGMLISIITASSYQR